MKAKKTYSKSANKKSVKKQFESWLKKVNNVHNLLKKYIKNIIDDIVNRNKT